MVGMNILVIEDNEKINSLILAYLKEQGVSSQGKLDGIAGLDEALRGIYDVIVLDLMIPGIPGLEVLQKLRASGSSTPVLILTAKDSLDDKMEGFRIGADDYLTKPFAFEELFARIKALAKRKGSVIVSNPSYGDIELDEDQHDLKKGTLSIHLGAKEFELMQTLFRNAGKPVGKEMLLNRAWAGGDEGDYNSIEVYISFLRKKLTALKSNVIIKSLRGIGYELVEEKLA